MAYNFRTRAAHSFTVLVITTQIIGHFASLNDVLDPRKEACEYFSGEYSREYKLGIVCCGNDTLSLPTEFTHQDSKSKSVLYDCSAKFKDDPVSDLPTAVWKDVLCEMTKHSIVKPGKLSFQNGFDFMTSKYPAKITSQLKKLTTKCSAIDSQKITDDLKMEKYIECLYAAEQKVCHKPYGQLENREHETQKAKEHGCPVLPGLVSEPPIEYCCRNRSIPYPIIFFPIDSSELVRRNREKVDQCKESFAKREQELINPKSSKGTTSADDEMSLSWDKLCATTCLLLQKNYTQALLKLNFEMAVETITVHYGKAVKDELETILKRRKDTKIFRSMDGPKTKPLSFQELSAKFLKASEKEKIPYFCKFVETILFEERRALHEYCIDEKFANEWGDDHRTLFAASR